MIVGKIEVFLCHKISKYLTGVVLTLGWVNFWGNIPNIKKILLCAKGKCEDALHSIFKKWYVLKALL